MTNLEKEISALSDAPGELPWWGVSKGLFFQCLGCGRCCRGASGGVFMRPCEEERIASELSISRDELRRRFETKRWRFPSLRERDGGRCIMNGHDNRCRIYRCRPIECRTWPFWPELLESPESWDRAARHCPGMNSGTLWTPSQIAAVLKAHEDYVKKLSAEWSGEWNKEGY